MKTESQQEISIYTLLNVKDFAFADITEQCPLTKDTWCRISLQATQRQQQNEIKKEHSALAHGHVYSINSKLYAYCNGYIIPVPIPPKKERLRDSI
jgi:hypothetical protein